MKLSALPLSPIVFVCAMSVLLGSVSPIYASSGGAREAKAVAKAFLEANEQREGVTVTRSGLQYEVLFKGPSDRLPRWRDTVKLHYHGTLIDGTVFDSSIDKGEPLSTPLRGLIDGWTEGIRLVSPGDKYRFYVPSSLGYGGTRKGSIPAHSILIFDIELLEIIEK